MNKKIILITSAVIILLLLIILVFPIPVLHEVLAKSISSPCGYSNYAWGEARGECECVGIKIDTSCRECMDAGASHGCIGIVKNRVCYQTINRTETQVNCR